MSHTTIFHQILFSGMKANLLDSVTSEIALCKVIQQLQIFGKRPCLLGKTRKFVQGDLKFERTQTEVAKKFGIAQSVISRLRYQFQEDRNANTRFSTGRPIGTTPQTICI